MGNQTNLESVRKLLGFLKNLGETEPECGTFYNTTSLNSSKISISWNTVFKNAEVLFYIRRDKGDTTTKCNVWVQIGGRDWEEVIRKLFWATGDLNIDLLLDIIIKDNDICVI